MRKSLALTLAGALVILFVCTVNYAQDVGEAKRPSGDDAVPVEMGEYEYVVASDLSEKLEDFVGKHVKIVDQLAVVWDQSTPHDSKDEKEDTEQKGYKGDHDNQTLTKKSQYMKFETMYFRCLLPEEFEGSTSYLKEVNSAVAYDDVAQVKPKLKYVCLYGKVIRTTVWGKIAPRGEGAVEPETIVLMVHKAEQPPKRFFEDTPNEEDQ